MAGLPDSERAAINELFARYAWGLDTHDLDSWIELFMPDGLIQMPGLDPFVGREEILRYGHFLTDDPKYPGRQHWVGQTIIEGDGSPVVAHSYAMITQRFPEGHSSLLVSARYRDVLVKHEGSWRFQERVGYRWGGDILSRFKKD
jgi:uncharacterized protein (TIGR02246 family)